MTDEEKRQQKAMLLLEHQEAESDLAHLREKAATVAKPYGEIYSWLNDASIGYMGGFNESKLQLNTNIRNNTTHYKNAINFAEAMQVMDELVEAQKRVDEAARRKYSLGLK